MRLNLLIFVFILGLLSSSQSIADTEIEQRNAIYSTVHKSFLAEDFSQLEKISSSYRTTKSRMPSGVWKLTMFYFGIIKSITIQTQTSDVEGAYQALEAKTKKWAHLYPNSPSAHIVYSLVLIQHGWAYRGEGYSSTVQSKSWAPFQRYIALSKDNLEKYKSVAMIDPTWYQLMIEIAKDEGWDRKKFDDLFNEATDREPLYYQTYFYALEYFLPKWHGNLNEIESFALNAVKRTEKQEGWSMYARIYWYASQSEFNNDIFNKSLAEWPKMKNGFEDIIAKYPDAWNLNNYAKFACLAQDKIKAKELLIRTDASVIPDAWTPFSMRWQCKQWVS